MLNIGFTQMSEVESRTQGSRARPRTQKNPRPRPRTALLRTDTFEAKDQRHKRNCSPKKKVFSKIFQAISKKRSSQKFFRRSPENNVFQKFFQALHKLLTIQKIVLSSSRGQGNFRGLEASRPRPRNSNVSSRTPSQKNIYIMGDCYSVLVNYIGGQVNANR